VQAFGGLTMGWAGTYRTLGPKGFASYALSRAVAALPGIAYHRYQLIAVSRAAMPSMPRGHAARALDESEVRHVAQDVDLSDATIDFRLRQGMTCIGAFRGERLLGVTWLTDRPFDEDEVAVRFVPPPGAAWDTGLYLRPEDRGGRGFAALWAGTAAWLDERRLGWSMSRITDYNDGSWRAHARMGARTVDTLTALRIGDRQWLIGAQPRLTHLTASASPPVLLLPLPGDAA
jgi:hypothetical protein